MSWPMLAGAQHAPISNQDAQAAPPERINPTELYKFAAAYQKVTHIRKKLMIETHGMTDDSKIAALKTQAQQKMKQAIEDQMTLSEYVRIGNAVNTNPALHARFMKMRNTARAAPAGTANG